MNYRWGDFGDGAGIDVPYVPTTGHVVTVSEGPYLLTVDGGTVHLRIGDSIASGEGTPLPRGSLPLVHSAPRKQCPLNPCKEPRWPN